MPMVAMLILRDMGWAYDAASARRIFYFAARGLVAMLLSSGPAFLHFSLPYCCFKI